MSEDKNEITKLFEQHNYDVDAIISQMEFYASLYGLSEIDKLHIQGFILTLYQFRIIENHCS